MMKRNRLFIIGNGFDLAHDLKTNYWNFRVFLNNVDTHFITDFEEAYNIYQSFDDEDKKQLLWNQFEKNLANIKEDLIIEYAKHIDLGVETGEVAIEETLRNFFSEKYSYINKLQKYLKRWVRTIKIRDLNKLTHLLTNDDFYITFNYTSVLERTYNISSNNIIHIHGSLYLNDDDPIIGHGNNDIILSTQDKLQEYRNNLYERETAIYDVLLDYYKKTFKNVDYYKRKLTKLCEFNIDEVIVIGHSLCEVDLPYFNLINMYLQQPNWTIYFHKPEEEQTMIQKLLNIGVSKDKIQTISDINFYSY